MARLKEILPREQLVARFGADLLLEEYERDEMNVIIKKKPEGVFPIAANVWNRIVMKRWRRVNPLQLASHFQTSDPYLYKAISDHLSIDVIRDIYYVKGWIKSRAPSNLVLEMLVAWVYKNDLQLADITFINPNEPIPRSNRRFLHQTHKGLGLFPVLATNLKRKAVELGCDQLTLTAAARDLVPFFSKFGFIVEKSKSGRAGMKLGVGIPMEQTVREL